MPSSPVTPVSLPTLIGFSLKFFFFGILFVQFYIYHVHFPKDPWIFKCIVYFLFSAILVEVCLGAADVHALFAVSFTDMRSFRQQTYMKIIGPILSSVCSVIVHFFFCYRIYRIRRSAWPLCIVIALLAIAGLGGGIGDSAAGIIARSAFSRDSFHNRLHTATVFTWLGAGAATDVLIAVIMTVLLSQTELSHSTRNTSKKIIVLIVETNTLSATCALLFLFFYKFIPNTLYCVIPGFSLSGIYANTLLITLNNRAVMRRAAVDEESTSMSGLQNASTLASRRTV
ncbi:hypothetical protein R3P38DRAFT_2833172 [Favolaschia claudopus]|uniref:DUF6534 domain-containing protein n=1 Tax=Favolaschia claudopus TaxID=2862362 RepID=A0AAW0EF98_9AGAR